MSEELNDRSDRFAAPHPLNVDVGSLRSLYITAISNGVELGGHGTGFLLDYNEKLYLITNRHVATGRWNTNIPIDKWQRTPDQLQIRFSLRGFAVGALTKTVELYEENEPLWFEHPEYRREVDVVAIEVCPPKEPKAFWSAYEFTHLKFERPVMRVTDELFVVGFPFDVDRNMLGLPVWTRASVASEPRVHFRSLPCFLIDARTRSGQSGSPVIEHLSSGMESTQLEHGEFFLATDLLVGVYSGRVNKDSDLGFVWRAAAIKEVIDGQFRPNYMEHVLPPIKTV